MSARERKEEDRLKYLAQVRTLEASKLVFVDESGFRRGMVPTYGRSPRGEGCFAQTQNCTAETTNLIAALSFDGIQATMTLEGSVDAAIFEVFVEHILLPTLPPGHIVICDNYKIHKSARTRQLLESCGCHLVFLPTYSPDFNPIELAFSKIKAFVRCAKVMVLAALDATLTQAIKTITLQDILGWFRHAGYAGYH